VGRDASVTTAGRRGAVGPISDPVAMEAGSAPPAPDDGMFAALRSSSSFRDLWLGTIVTNTAFWMYQIAIGWLALDLTDSPFFVGLTGFAGGIPLLFLALPAGVIIDRVDRRKVLLIAQAGIMTISIVFAVLVATDSIQRWSILVLSFLYGSVMSFVFPTRNALVPSLVIREQLRNAVALNAAGQNATRVLGPSLAGVLIAVGGVAGTFAVAALAQIAALAWTSRLPRAPRSTTTVARSLRGSVSEGIDVVASDRLLTGLILLATIVTVLIMPYINYQPAPRLRP
jgi:MFS family permease